MMINTDDLFEILREKIDITARRVLETTDMSHDKTQWERGRVAAFKELASWVEQTYGSDSQ